MSNRDPVADDALCPDSPLLSLKGVSRHYPGSDAPAIDRVSIDIYPGEFVAIVGPSGSGKSTLLNILGLLDTPTGGEYHVLGLDTGSMNEKELNHLRSTAFGFIFQSSHVLGDESVLANTAMGLRVQRVPNQERARLAAAALAQLGLERKTMARAKLLSGGERQRVAIARAIATSPALILADEPTGNLDSDNSQKVVEHLRSLHQAGATVVIITHDMDVAAAATRRIGVLDGRIVQDATSTVGEPIPPVPKLAPPTVLERNVGRLGSWRSLVDDVLAAVSALSTRGVRTLLLVLAFALGIGGLVTSAGLSETASAQITSRLTAAALDEVRVDLDDPATHLVPNGDQLSMDLQRLNDLPHVEGAGFLATVDPAGTWISRLHPSGQEPRQAIGLASASASLLNLAATQVMPAASAQLLEDPSVGPVALVSKNAATALGLPVEDGIALSSGYAIWIDGTRVPVVGSFQVNDRFQQLENSVVVSPGVLANNANVQLSIVIRTEMGFPASVARAVPITLNPASPGSIKTRTVADLDALRYGVSNDLGLFVGILSAVLLALTAASAATVMYLTVQSRTSEIALLRAIGASRGFIGRLFIIEGLLISSMGGAIGVALGVAGTLLGATAQGWTPVLASGLPLVGLGAAACTGLLSSLYPAWVASRQNPATAIRN